MPVFFDEKKGIYVFRNWKLRKRWSRKYSFVCAPVFLRTEGLDTILWAREASDEFGCIIGRKVFLNGDITKLVVNEKKSSKTYKIVLREVYNVQTRTLLYKEQFHYKTGHRISLLDCMHQTGKRRSKDFFDFKTGALVSRRIFDSQIDRPLVQRFFDPESGEIISEKFFAAAITKPPKRETEEEFRNRYPKYFPKPDYPEPLSKQDFIFSESSMVLQALIVADEKSEMSVYRSMLRTIWKQRFRTVETQWVWELFTADERDRFNLLQEYERFIRFKASCFIDNEVESTSEIFLKLLKEEEALCV